MVRQSATLAIDARVRALRAAGAEVLHLGFGEAGLPVLPEVVSVLAEAAARSGSNAYGTVAGAGHAREAAAGYFTRRGLRTEPDQIVFAPGSKALLFALIAAIPGEVVLPRPSWVSYAAQAALAGKPVIGLPIAEAAGGIPDPDRLEAALSRAESEGRRPGVLVLTAPDNPTGTLAPRDLVRAVTEIAAAHDLWVVSDEIYRDLAYDPDAVTTPATFLPDRTVITAGLSKATALGGWRVGFARLPAGGGELHDAVVGIGSEVWSSLATPMQQVAAYVLADPPPVRSYVERARRLHATVAQAVYEAFVAAGARCRPPQGAFYLYPDLAELRAAFPESVARDGTACAEHLLDKYGVGVLAGAAFGDNPSALRFRVATSLLYGDSDEERQAALDSDEPLSLPWIRASLDRLNTVLGELRERVS